MSDEQKSDELCVNTIRCLAIDMVQKAKSGHPGMPLGMAPAAHVLWSRILKSSASNPNWPNRDRFILSNGHGCSMLYTMLHLCGFKISMDDLKNFRQIDSITPGHPEAHETEGVEATTGPLGQGIANAVGMAMAQTHAAALFNKDGHTLVDHKIYVFCGDGCLQEGVSSEAASLAGHWKLKNLILIYDDNRITIDGGTHLSFTEDVPKRFQSYGWNTLTVENGNEDLDAIENAIKEAHKSDRPTIISLKTDIGFGSPKVGLAASHGAPLGPDGVAATKQTLGMNPDEFFHVPDAVTSFYENIRRQNAEAENKWQADYLNYAEKYPKEAAEFQRIFVDKQLPENWAEGLPSFTPEDKTEATRKTHGRILNTLAERIPEMVGGSADLTPSNCTQLKCSHDYQHDSPDGRYIRFGVREFGMVAICNGISLYGLIPFSATFLNFITYSFPAVRLGALSHVRQLHIMTHDSICLGEDGPTHQPVEVLPLLRATPNLLTLRPCDANEVVGSYVTALSRPETPAVLCFTRQGVPILPGTSAEKVRSGAYVIYESSPGQKSDLAFISSGSEVSLVKNAAKELEKSGLNIRVVSCPCQELFMEQSLEYRREVLPVGVPVISAEASVKFGWGTFSHSSIGLDSFGASAPYKDLLDKFGFTTESVVKTASDFLDKIRQQSEVLGMSVVGLLPCQLN